MPSFLGGKDTQLSACKSMASKRLQMTICKTIFIDTLQINWYWERGRGLF